MKEMIAGCLVAVAVIAAIVFVTPKRSTWIRMCPQPDITAYEVARLMSENRSDLVKEPSIARHLCKDGM